MDKLEQGDLLLNVKYYHNIEIVNGSIEVMETIFPYLFIMNMSCDLEQSSGNDKPLYSKMYSVLVCPGYPINYFQMKIHTIGLESNLNVIKDYSKNNKVGSDEMKIVKKNDNKRYHFVSKDKLADNFPIDLVIDFKHFFTMKYDDLLKYKQTGEYFNLGILFRESLTQRFSHYISRIGLPL